MKPIIHVQKSKINHRYYFNNNDSFYSIFYRLCIWLKPVSMFFKKAQKLQPPVYKGKAKKGRGISSALRCRCLCPWGLLFSGVYRCPLCTFCTVCSFPLSLSPAPQCLLILSFHGTKYSLSMSITIFKTRSRVLRAGCGLTCLVFQRHVNIFLTASVRILAERLFFIAGLYPR